MGHLAERLSEITEFASKLFGKMSGRVRLKVFEKYVYDVSVVKSREFG
jgi:hypothetical protein